MINESDVREREGQKADFPMVQALGPAFTIDVSSKTTEPPQIILGIPVKVDPDLPPGTVALVGGTVEQPEAVVMTNVATEQEEDPALAQYPAWQLVMRKSQLEGRRNEAKRLQKEAEEAAKKQVERDAKDAPVLKLALSLLGIEAEPTKNEVTIPGGYTFTLQPFWNLDGKRFAFNLSVHRSLPEGVRSSMPYVVRTLNVAPFNIDMPKTGTAGRLADLIDEIDAEYQNEIDWREAQLKRQAEQPSKPEYSLPVASTLGEALEARIRDIVRDEINGATHHGDF